VRRAIEHIVDYLRKFNPGEQTDALHDLVMDALDAEAAPKKATGSIEKADTEEETEQTREMLVALKGHKDNLSDWELDFCKSVSKGFQKYKSLTRKQFDRLSEIFDEKCGDPEEAENPAIKDEDVPF
jgi:hypothetical protein